MRTAVVLLAAFGLSACIAIPGAVDEDHLAPRSLVSTDVFPGLDVDSHEQQSMHFLARAYGNGKAIQAADLAEVVYQRIMVDTGLGSTQPLSGVYKLLIYANAEEYHRKTGQPPWSLCVCVDKSIFSYAGAHLDGALSYELTRLIFSEYVGHADPDHRWLSEGLAAYEESKAGQPASGGAAPTQSPWPRGWQPLTLDFMLHMPPASERDRATNVWYIQAVSMVRFMIERGGRIGFSQFLSDLRLNYPFDKAVGDAFPGAWKDLANFYSAWASAQQ